MANNHIKIVQPELPATDGTNNYLYDKLWKLCAGSLFDLPQSGENVYYFPQGHIEQIVTSINDELCQLKPIFDIPSKIRCNVISTKLKVEANTEEVYAEISLLPDTAEFEILIPSYNNKIENISYFTKVLSVSDTSAHGAFSLVKRHAIECLPPLDMSQPMPSQEIVAKDLHGYEWRFKHIFRGRPQRHLFTTGWTTFANKKKLAAGDSFVFLRGENGESRVGIRKSNQQQGNIPSSIISKQSMHHGVIATALNAIKKKCMLVVLYKPSSSQFVVNFNKFVDAVNKKFNIGSRFMMKFEGRDFNEIRYSGTIVGMGDFSTHWKDSEWRSLEVQWDEAAIIQRPHKVSPWEIEPLTLSLNTFESASLKNKRQRKIHEFGSNMWIPTLTQGQEIGQSSKRSPINVPQLSYHGETDDPKIPSGVMSYSGPTMSKPSYNDQMVQFQSMKEKLTTNTTASYRLFGVDLATPTETKDLMGSIDSYQICEEKKLDEIQMLTSSKEIQGQQTSSIKSRIKVHMEGADIERTVDLTVFDGYNQLIYELEKLFNIEGKLHKRNQWEIVFKDHEEDMMLVGDHPWPEFCNMVKEIFICSKEDVEIVEPENLDVAQQYVNNN